MRWLLLLSLPACLVTQADLDRRLDADQDGFDAIAFGGDDCDDADPAVFPGATEHCNGVDDDCNGVVDDGPSARTVYRDADGDGHGDPDVSRIVCEDVDGWVGDATDCDDTRADVSPSAAVVVGDWVDNRCTGQGDVWPASETGWWIEAQSADDSETPFVGGLQQRRFGWSIAGIADATGDGVPDLVVGAPGTANAQGGSALPFAGGSIAILPGPIRSNRPYDAAHLIFTGRSAEQQLGHAVAGGDLDGDGVAEVIAGGSRAGIDDVPARVYILRGPVTAGVDTAAPIELVGQGRAGGANPSEGYALGFVPRFDDAGAGLVVGQLGGDRVTLIAGLPTAGLLSEHLRIVGSADEALGAELATDGDTDGDGWSDIALGAPLHDEFTGAAYVFRGPFEGDRATADADATFFGDTPSQTVGGALAWGDLNGDGYDDLVVGARLVQRVWVVFGPVEGAHDPSTADVALVGQSGAFAFTRVAVPGDLDGDGHADLAVADYELHSDRGGVYVFRGPIASGSYEQRDAARIGTLQEQRFAGSLAVAPDWNGDGRPELLVGASNEDVGGLAGAGRVYVFPSAGL